MKCVSYTRTLPWKNHQDELAIAEQNQRIAAYLAEHKELDLLKKYSDRKNDEKARIAFDQMTNDGVERKFDCIIVASMYYCGPCLLYTSPSPRDSTSSRMPSSA